MKWLTGAAIFILILSVIIYRLEDGGAKEMSKHENNMITHCVGRSSIKLPEHYRRASVTTGIFKAVGSTAQDPPFEVIVKENSFTPKSFLLEMSKRRSELRENSDGAVDVLKNERTLNNDAVIFRVQRIDDAYVSEMNFLRGPSLVTIKVDSFRSQYAAAEENLIRFGSAFKESGSESSAASPQDFCLGSVAISGDFKDESGSFLFRKEEEADFEIEINTYAPNAGEPLLVRMSKPDSILRILNVDPKILRSGERNMTGLRAQEWLGWAKLSDEESAKSFKFTLETVGPTPSKTSPSISLIFSTGKPLPGGGTAKTTLSDEEAMQLWDVVVDSIRPTTR